MKKDLKGFNDQENNIAQQGMTIAEVAIQQYDTLDMGKALPWMIFVVFFGVLNETVFNIAMPSIAEQFGLQPSGVSLVITSFMIFFAIGSVIYGKLSDTYQIKKLIIIGLLIYSSGSILGFIAYESYLMVVGARIIQGVGGSAISALMMVIIARHISQEDRGKAFGIVGSTVAFSEGVGPVVGGVISGSYHWSFLFLIPLFTLLAIPFFYKNLPNERLGKGKVDILGATLLVIGLVLVSLYFSEPNWLFIIVGLLFLVWFMVHIRRSHAPFIEPVLFTRGKFISVILSGFILFGTGMGILFMMPFMLYHVHQLTPDRIGWILFPGSMSVIIFGAVGGILADRRGNPLVLYLGVFLLMSSLLAILLLIDGTSWLISGALLLTYVGISFIKTAVSNSVTQTLEMEEIGIGMGMFSLTSFLSEAVGTMIIGKTLENQMFNISLFSLANDPATFVYSNILLILIASSLLGGAVYMYGHR